MNDDHQIAAKSQKKIHKLPSELLSYWIDVHQIFAQCSQIIAMWSFKAA